jgi:hypothetical protein
VLGTGGHLATNTASLSYFPGTTDGTSDGTGVYHDTLLENVGQNLEQKSTQTSGAISFTFTDIDVDELILMCEGLSHNSGVNQTLSLEYSTNSGGAWAGFVNPVVAAHTAAQVVNGALWFRGLKAGRVIGINGLLVSTMPVIAGSPDVLTFNPAAQVNGLRLIYSGGLSDAGTVRQMSPAAM